MAGKQAEFGEIALVACGEDELQFDQSAAEDAEEGLGNGPLADGVMGGGKGSDALQKLEEVVAAVELIENGDEAGVFARFSTVVKL